MEIELLCSMNLLISPANINKRGPYNVTTIETRRNITRMYINGVSKANIVRNLQIPKSTILSVISRHFKNAENLVESRGGP